MKLAFVYAGQGSQKVGMGQDFYQEYEVFREVLDKVEVDFDLKEVSFNGPEEILNQTQYTQACMVAFAVGVTKLLRTKGIVPQMACGLSLGEYSALYASGFFTENQVISIAQFRGKVMQEAAANRSHKMLAVIGADREVVEKVCEAVNTPECVVSVANYNCPGQIVISGDEVAVDMAKSKLYEAGVKKLLPLKVSGPFHTSLMKPAGDALKERFRKESFGSLAIPVVFNLTAKELDNRSVEEMLVNQVQSSVYFEDSIHYMAAKGIDTVIEIGPGKTLSKFIKKTNNEITCYSIDTVEDFKNICEIFNGGCDE